MKLKLSHKGQERELDLGVISIREGNEMRDLTGWAPRAWQMALNESDPEACGYAWFWACKRDGVEITWLDVLDDFNIVEFQAEYVADETPAAPVKDGKESDPTGSVTKPDKTRGDSTSGNPGSSSISDSSEKNS